MLLWMLFETLVQKNKHQSLHVTSNLSTRTKLLLREIYTHGFRSTNWCCLVILPLQYRVTNIFLSIRSIFCSLNKIASQCGVCIIAKSHLYYEIRNKTAPNEFICLNPAFFPSSRVCRSVCVTIVLLWKNVHFYL